MPLAFGLSMVFASVIGGTAVAVSADEPAASTTTSVAAPMAAKVASAANTVAYQLASGTTAFAVPAKQKELVDAAVSSVDTVRASVEKYFADEPIMIQVSRCESHFRQFEADGSVYRGKVNNADVGVMQINEYYHEDTAEKMGINLHTLDGNLQYARYLYEKEGTRPWNSSSACWAPSKSTTVASTAKTASAELASSQK